MMDQEIPSHAASMDFTRVLRSRNRVISTRAAESENFRPTPTPDSGVGIQNLPTPTPDSRVGIQNLPTPTPDSGVGIQNLPTPTPDSGVVFSNGRLRL